VTFCFVFCILAGIADPRAAQSESPPAEIAVRVTSLDLPDLCIVTCMAVATDGTRLLCTPLALYTLLKSGNTIFLAGHTTERGFKDGQGGAARFAGLTSIAVDGAGNCFVADSFNHALRKVTRNGAVSTLAGNGEAGYADGVGDAVRFNKPYGIALDADGTIYVADCENNCVRQVSPDDGAVSTLAGEGKEGAGFADGPGSTARFFIPGGLALDTDSHLIVADMGNHCIRRVTTAEGHVTTVAGSPVHGHGVSDGEGAAARFYIPMGIAVDGNNNILVADCANNLIRMIAGSTACVTTVVGSAEQGKVDGTGACARFLRPIFLALDEHGSLLVADHNQNCLRVVEASLEPPRQLLAATVLLLQVCARSPCRYLVRAVVELDPCVWPVFFSKHVLMSCSVVECDPCLLPSWFTYWVLFVRPFNLSVIH